MKELWNVLSGRMRVRRSVEEGRGGGGGGGGEGML